MIYLYLSSNSQSSILMNSIAMSLNPETFLGDAKRELCSYLILMHVSYDRYNFDPVNEWPLPGRYEWEKLDS